MAKSVTLTERLGAILTMQAAVSEEDRDYEIVFRRTRAVVSNSGADEWEIRVQRTTEHSGELPIYIGQRASAEAATAALTEELVRNVETRRQELTESLDVALQSASRAIKMSRNIATGCSEEAEAAE